MIKTKVIRVLCSAVLAISLLFTQSFAVFASMGLTTNQPPTSNAAQQGVTQPPDADADADITLTSDEDKASTVADAESNDPSSDSKPSTEPTKEEALNQIMNTNPEDADIPVVDPPKIPKASHYKQYPFPNEMIMSGIFENQSIFFKVPNYWETEYAYARIEFTLSQLIREDVPASLTFMINNIPIYSCRMNYDYGRTQTIYVTIPIELLNEGYNSFDLTGYVRLFDDEGCIDDLSGANWVNISQDSFIEVGYELLPHNKRIYYYPYPFMSSVEEDGSTTQVVVSDAMAESELSAALLLRADLASETSTSDNITLTTMSQMRHRHVNVNTVMVSELDNLPGEFRAYLTKEELESERMSSAALVKFVMYKYTDEDDEDHYSPLLIVTSKNGDCLMEAAMMLVDTTRSTQEPGSTAWVLANASQKIKENSVRSELTAGRYTIDGLVGSGINYVGPFHQVYTVYLPFSGGYVLNNSSKISLTFRYSENLDFDRSLITVYWGTVPVASKKLTRENASGDELSFVMPADVIGTTAQSLVIAFDLELPELFCTPRMDEMPWAYITGDSSLYLPLGVNSRLSFNLRPFPFEESSMYNNLTMVVPDSPSTVELDLMGHIASIYGESITSYGEIRVVRDSTFMASDDKAKDCNVIVIGNYNDSSLIRSLNDRLAFKYNEDGTEFIGNDKLVLSENYCDRIGSMQMFHSEYAAGRAILVVGGINDTTLGYIRDFMTSDENVWKISGDTVLIDSEGEIRPYVFLEDTGRGDKPGLKDFFMANKDSIIFTITATSAMLMLLLGCIFILLRIYGRSRENKKK